jgi:hypothetical protein
MSRCSSGWRRVFLRFGTRSPARIRCSATIRSRIAPSVVIRVLTSMSLAPAVRVTARFELQDTGFNEHSEDLGKLGLIRLIRRRRQICLGCIDRLTPAVAAKLGAGSVLQPELGITLGDLDLTARAGARPGLANLPSQRCACSPMNPSGMRGTGASSHHRFHRGAYRGPCSANFGSEMRLTSSLSSSTTRMKRPTATSALRFSNGSVLMQVIAVRLRARDAAAAMTSFMPSGPRPM